MAALYSLYLSVQAPLLGSINLLSHYNLDSACAKYCGAKKLKKDLSSFLSHLPGNLDVSSSVMDDRFAFTFLACFIFSLAHVTLADFSVDGRLEIGIIYD